MKNGGAEQGKKMKGVSLKKQRMQLRMVKQVVLKELSLLYCVK